MTSEHDEAVKFVQWLNYKKIKHWHIPQETFTKSWNQKRKNKEAGVNKGISDYLVIIEHSRLGRQLTLWIELKKQKKILQRKSSRGKKGDLVAQNDATPEQLAFIDLVNKSADTLGVVCYGGDEAISTVNKYL